MKDERILYTFEFEISADILSKLKCNSPIDEILDGNALDLTGNIRHSVSLVKADLSYPKFIFQIFSEKLLKDASQQSEKDDKSFTNNSQQTEEEIKKTFECLSQQTDVKLYSEIHQQTELITSHSSSQTTVHNFSDNEAQTTTLEYFSTSSNTNESRMLQSTTSTLTDQNLGSFKDAESMAEVDTVDSMCQVASETVEQGCQNCTESSDANIQTSPLLDDACIQTDEKSYTTLEAQTTNSMANETDAGIQASTETSDIEVQASSEVSHADSQTLNGCLSSIEEETQAGVLMTSDEAQTEADVVDQDMTTDHNLLSQRSNSTQACIELFTQAQQTSILGIHCSDHSILKQMESEDERLETSNLSSEVDPPRSILNSTLGHSVDATFTSDNDDVACQTDPVTIIIGDASFLVQKLKSSAVNSSKVTTSGNEIEIELSVDNETVKTETNADQKQQQNRQQKRPQQQQVLNKQQQKTPQQQQKTPQQQLKDKTPQQKVQSALKPRMGGVRMRMPVTPTTPRSNSHIRHTTPIQSPKPSSKAPGEALFSCPFCSLNFSESPALYEHLSEAHKSDTQSKWRKSQGREGKTIIPRQNQTPKNSGKKKPASSGTTPASPSSDSALKRKVAVAASETGAKVPRLQDES